MSIPGNINSPSDLILYQTEDGKTRIQCRFEDESLWLTQAQMADLFQTTPQNITQHIRALYEEGELSEDSTCKPFLQVRLEGGRQVKRQLSHYSLPVILAVGFRVRSQRGTQFRQWANEHLSEYLVKGFAMDDERLRQPVTSGLPDYFDELLERIRDTAPVNSACIYASKTSWPWLPTTSLRTPKRRRCSRQSRTSCILL
jgi:hypothetical protein